MAVRFRGDIGISDAGSRRDEPSIRRQIESPALDCDMPPFKGN